MNWYTVAPILVHGTESLPLRSIDLGNGVKLKKIPKWLKDDTVLADLSKNNRLGIRGFPSCLLFEHDGRPTVAEAYENALQKTATANIALWLAEPTSVGFPLVLHCNLIGRSWNLVSATPYNKVWALKDYAGNNLSAKDTTKARKLCQAMNKRQGSLRAATRLLWSALTQHEYASRYINLWAAIESLFGTSSGELRYRISLRIAFFLKKNKADALNIFQKAMGAYDLRSKFVHGVEPKISPLMDQQIFDSEMFLRNSLSKILLDPNHIATFSGKNRETYLEALLFK